MTPNPIPEGKAITGSVAKYLDSRFLNSITLAGILQERGEETLKVTIDRAEHLEKLRYENGQTDTNVVLLYFQKSDKPLKLCKDNLKRLTRQLGPLGTDWNGREIHLCIEQCRRPDLGGEQGDCVRVARKTL